MTYFASRFLPALGCALLASLANVSPSRSEAKTSPQTPAMETNLTPNEAGQIPILEYHELVPRLKVTGYQYPSSLFRRDMEWLYDHNYRPVNLLDYVAGKIDCPAGMSPVILTFDDSLGGQFRYLPDGTIDPNSAVGILEDLHRRHDDWPLRGTFFVLTEGHGNLPPPFYQKSTAKKKMKYLVAEGFEIGNHTVSHQLGIRHWTDEHVQAEIGGAVIDIQKYLPGYNVQELALPFGVYPKNDHLVVSGETRGMPYHNACALLAGYRPAPSPMSKSFDPYHLERIIPGDRQFEVRYWLSWLQQNPAKRFISDGDPTTYTLPEASRPRINLTRLQAMGFIAHFSPGPKAVPAAHKQSHKRQHKK
ncbi:xylanase [Capsulimonas corticalis]|uniref:Xylanase n=1 Tax=Capsulimonas corticalis TaxID=2219043 RepID=A0A402CVM4_9BACT|nr:polysaccharide deacetylase family protein [Capsulimonas corticalis]BDI30455.1 xylanase [Capsulimonas corticalis]